MPTAYLTIDDAPSETLPDKLEILETRDVPAIFFCEGRRLDEYAGHARQAVEAGYHLGNHAYSHEHAADLTVEAFRDEVERTEALLDDVYESTGVSRPATLFRFPFGDRGGENANAFQNVLADVGFVPPDSQPFTYPWYAEEHADMRDWFWTVAVDDWTAETRAELERNLENVDDRFASNSADIILFHDAGNTTDLFRDFLDLLAERDVDLRDPLELVD